MNIFGPPWCPAGRKSSPSPPRQHFGAPPRRPRGVFLPPSPTYLGRVPAGIHPRGVIATLTEDALPRVTEERLALAKLKDEACFSPDWLVGAGAGTESVPRPYPTPLPSLGGIGGCDCETQR
jgi:hypothetical protein